MSAPHSGLPARAGEAAQWIDHTLLAPHATSQEVERLCEEARTMGCAAVCVATQFVAQCVEALRDTGVRVACVIDFPMGSDDVASATAAMRHAQDAGAVEIDAVFPHGLLAGGDEDRARAKVEALVQARRPGNALKMILETGLIAPELKRRAAEIATRAGVDFLKTSTGFFGGGATLEDVALLRAIGGAEMGVKASGGIRDRQTFEAMIRAGATRIGTSSAAGILGEYEA